MSDVYILRIPALEWLVKTGLAIGAVGIAAGVAVLIAAAIKEGIDRRKWKK